MSDCRSKFWGTCTGGCPLEVISQWFYFKFTYWYCLFVVFHYHFCCYSLFICVGPHLGSWFSSGESKTYLFDILFHMLQYVALSILKYADWTLLEASVFSDWCGNWLPKLLGIAQHVYKFSTPCNGYAAGSILMLEFAPCSLLVLCLSWWAINLGYTLILYLLFGYLCFAVITCLFIPLAAV